MANIWLKHNNREYGETIMKFLYEFQIIKEDTHQVK
jgi:hypothetical protein